MSVFAIPHYHDTANSLTLSVKLGNTPAHLWTDTNLSNVFQAQGRAILVNAQWNIPQILLVLNVTSSAYHVFRFCHFDNRCSNLLIASLNGRLDMTQGDIESA